ncbi:Lipopolysaccharide biosynthesis regulator YciM, contains six TPR domains and a predicted metal-binding C-terminal domain [Prevotellaceae bacterium HUN156]|nr:Lipopolysaccharide biosynthesis regulator YciM, contains six TPR domains and a predicted metal-binding C-terminal domain [Prevotellaceae bacterium HUN156]
MLWCVAVQSVAQDADRNRRYDAFFLDAICQREKGNNDAVFDLLRHCVDIDSTRSEAYYYLAQYYSALKQKDMVLSYLKKSVELEPDNATYLETLANAYLNQRKYKDAIDVLELLCKKKHNRDDVLALLIQLYEQENDYDNAIRTLGRLETIEGKSERLSYAKSDLYTKKGDKKAAIAEMKQLADQYPNDNNYRCLYANTLYINGQKKKAVAIYDKVLKEEPDNRNAQMAMVAYYNDQKDSANVNRMIERVLFNKNASTSDRVALMRQVIGESEEAGGDSTRVLQLFHRLIDMPQADSDMALFCASYMNMKKMPNDSIRQVLEKVLEVSPDHAAARLQLVSYAWQAGDRDRIIELCKAARQYNPDEMAFYYYQGIAYYQKDDLDNALNAFQNGIGVITSDSDPSIVSDFYAVMGDILHQKGMAKEAFEAYDSCLVWKEDNIGCLNNYAYYLSEQGIRLDDAEKMSYRTIKAEPKNATYLDTYAWILFMQKRYDEAKTYIDQTLENDSTPSAVLFEHAGDIYYHVGDKEKALEYWQEASEQSDVSDERHRILTRKIKLKKYLKE